MYRQIQKIGLPVAFISSAALVLLSILMFNSKSISYEQAYKKAIESSEVKSETDSDKKNELARNIAKAELENSQIDAIGTLTTVSYAFTILAILFSVGLPLYFLRDQPKKILWSVGIIIGALVLWLIFYQFSSETVSKADVAFTATEAKLTGSLIGLSVLGTLLALGAMIYGEVKSIRNN